MSFRLVPKSVTLNDLERRNGVILRCFNEFGYLPGALRKSSRSLSHLLMSSCIIPANNTMPAFPSWRSPDVTTTATEAADIQLQLTTHLSSRKDERLSWPSWLTYSGWLTHLSCHPSATSRAQDSESTSAKDQCSTAGPRNHSAAAVRYIEKKFNYTKCAVENGLSK